MGKLDHCVDRDKELKTGKYQRERAKAWCYELGSQPPWVQKGHFGEDDEFERSLKRTGTLMMESEPRLFSGIKGRYLTGRY